MTEYAPLPSPEAYAAARSKLTPGWWYYAWSRVCAEAGWWPCVANLNGPVGGPVLKVRHGVYITQPTKDSLASAQPYDPRTRVGLGCCYKTKLGDLRGPMERYDSWEQGPYLWRTEDGSDTYTEGGQYAVSRRYRSIVDLDLSTAHWPEQAEGEQPEQAAAEVDKPTDAPAPELKPGMRVFADTPGMKWDLSIPLQVRERLDKGEWRDVARISKDTDQRYFIHFAVADVEDLWELHEVEHDCNAHVRIHPDWKPEAKFPEPDWKAEVERLERELAECKEGRQRWIDKCSEESCAVLRLREELKKAQELHQEAEIEAVELREQLKKAKGDPDAKEYLLAVPDDSDDKGFLFCQVNLSWDPATIEDCRNTAEADLKSEMGERFILRIVAKCVAKPVWEGEE